jgi:hypothetical protein
MVSEAGNAQNQVDGFIPSVIGAVAVAQRGVLEALVNAFN